MAINCAAPSEQLLESELFGHEKGAFTGATDRKRGRLELADGGTFLSTSSSSSRQSSRRSCLRVLQERRFERTSVAATARVDVHWVAATNRDLRAMIVATGKLSRGSLSPSSRGVPDQAAAAARRQELSDCRSRSTSLARIAADLKQPVLC